MKIRLKDKVKVISGKDKGKTGEVIKVLPLENKVIVQGVNIVKRHVKPGVVNKEGGIEHESEQAMHGKAEWIGTSDEIGYVQTFMKQCLIMNDENDYLQSKKIQHWIHDYSIRISMAKIEIRYKNKQVKKS